MALSKYLAVQIARSPANAAPELPIVLDTARAQVTPADTSSSSAIAHNMFTQRALLFFVLMKYMQASDNIATAVMFVLFKFYSR